ncbi:MAG: hypothetical protein ACTSX9_09785 [Candidatus Njordarchaeales archaeon]
MITKKQVALLLFLILFSASTIPVKEAEQQKSIPVLAVIKEASKDKVGLKEWFQIRIWIINIGNDTAYNVTLEDNPLPSWSFNISGKTTAHWDIIPPNVSIMFTYNVSVTNPNIPVVSLGRAKVTYYDKNGVKYVVFSEDLRIQVEIRAKEKIDWDSVWRIFVILEGLVLTSIMIPLIIIEINAYRKYKKAKRRK